MINASSNVFDIASRVSTFLGLAGLTLAVLFLLFRQLLAKDIFPALSKAMGGALLRLIVERVFILALAAMVLAFIAYLVARWGNPQASPKEPTAAAAAAILEHLYSRDYKAVYEEFSPSLKDQMPYVTFEQNVKATMSQFFAPPAYRHFIRKELVSGQLFFIFDSEFDQISRFREVITYVTTQTGWTLWRTDLFPSSWPLPGTEQSTTSTSATAVANRIRTVASASAPNLLAEEVLGHWIPLPGWTGSVNGVLAKQGERTCDLKLTENGSAVVIVARGVLDGCRLPIGTLVTLVGRIDGATADSVEISAVRLWSHVS